MTTTITHLRRVSSLAFHACLHSILVSSPGVDRSPQFHISALEDPNQSPLTAISQHQMEDTVLHASVGDTQHPPKLVLIYRLHRLHRARLLSDPCSQEFCSTCQEPKKLTLVVHPQVRQRRCRIIEIDLPRALSLAWRPPHPDRAFRVHIVPLLSSQCTRELCTAFVQTIAK